MVWYSCLKNFPQFVVIHTVKGFDIVKKAEIDVFLELSCFFNDPTDVDCSHEIKKQLLHGRQAMANLDSMLKSRDIAVPTKVHIVKVMVFQLSCMDVRGGP